MESYNESGLLGSCVCSLRTNGVLWGDLAAPGSNRLSVNTEGGFCIILI